MSDLYRRLKAAKARGEAPREARPAGEGPEKPRSDREQRAPEGFSLKDGVYLRRETIPLQELGAEATLLGPGEPVHVPVRLSSGPGLENPSETPLLETHIFFDLEATGLSTGAGNVAFLLGLGFLSRSGFELVQWLLPDYPYEPELLSAVASELQLLKERLGPLTLVSYNGRSFDTPLLRTRMLMNGIPFDPPTELDLLPISRRFWRGELENCSLGTVEEGVLSIQRELDVPGAFVPLRYFDYLRSGRPEPLLEVIAHHRQDILSLYLLLSRIEAILRGVAGSSGLGPDLFELGKLLIEQEPLPGARARGEALLRELTADGTAERAALYYGRHLRREGEVKEAYKVWSRAFRGCGSVAAGIMAAKLLEHQFREYEEALSLVAELLARQDNPPRLESSLLHRQERLRRRSASS